MSLTRVPTAVAYGALARRAAHRLRRLCKRNRCLVLSYDDGPGSEFSVRLLDLLQTHGQRATFFLLGMRVARHPEVVDRIAAAGHELGCHGQDHINAWQASRVNALEDISAGYETLSRWLPPNAPFRPPNGKITAATWFALRRRGAPICWWTVDSGDTHAVLPDPQSIVEQVQRDGGGVVLMHDFDRDPATREERSAYVLTVTRLLLELAQREGLTVRTYGELLRLRDRNGH